MCLTIFHLRDLGIRIIGMFPFFIRPLLRPFPIQLGQILLRRRLNPARFCQLREKLRVTFSRVPPNDGSHRRVGLQGRSVHPNRLPIDQSVFRQYLQHPRKHSAMGLQIDQSPRSRYRRMIRCALRQRESQKALQAQRVGAAPGNPSFRVKAFEISDDQQGEIHTRSDARPTHRFALVKTNALLFGELIKLFVLQTFIHPIVEDVPARSWQLSRRDPQWLLPRSFFTHRHRLSSPIATFFTDYGQCWSNYIEYSRLKSRLLQRAAGVTVAKFAGVGTMQSGYTTKISIRGARPEQNSFLLDGTDVMGPTNQIPGSVAGQSFGVDAVREFRVETSTYSAQYGRAAGGVINVVTKSGSNELHGSAFEFLRNDNLDAPRWDDNRAGREKPEFKRNQFGLSLGGPVTKDRTFFFGSYEGRRDRQGRTTTSLVPTAAVRTTAIPAVRPYVDAFWPLPNGPVVDPVKGIAEYNYTGFRSADEDYFTARVDHQLSSKDSIFGRYTFDDGRNRTPMGAEIFWTEDRSRK